MNGPSAVHVLLELEELPAVRVAADSLEDELRLAACLEQPSVRERLAAALLDMLDDIGEAP